MKKFEGNIQSNFEKVSCIDYLLRMSIVLRSEFIYQKKFMNLREPGQEAGSKMKCQKKHSTQNNKLKIKNNKPKIRTQIGHWTFSFVIPLVK